MNAHQVSTPAGGDREGTRRRYHQFTGIVVMTVASLFTMWLVAFLRSY